MAGPIDSQEWVVASRVRPFLRNVRIRNYRSIAQCFVELGSINVLVGRNGAGKSNFLDALRFTADAVTTTLDHALKTRGGIDAVRRRSTGHPRDFAVQFECDLSDDRVATYGFEVGSQPRGGFVVKQERVKIVDARSRVVAHYRVAEGNVQKGSRADMPPAARDRLYLVTASGLPEFRELHDAVLSMGFYHLNPDAMKEFQTPDAGELLHRDGSNIASVIGRLSHDQPAVMDRIGSYLASIVPGIVGVNRIALGPKETLEFRQEVVGSKYPWTFYAASMSDGTLRALGTLVAVTQFAGTHKPIRLVGLEEPETALHPAAAGALMDALREAACQTQIVVTTHSPDLIDEVDMDCDRLIAVQSVAGDTTLGSLDDGSLQTLRNQLFSAGELLRMDQLAIDPSDLDRQRQLVLFDLSEDEL